MSYRVEFTGAAARQVKKLPTPARDRVLAAIEALDAELIVTVVRAGHRRDVYEG